MRNFNYKSVFILMTTQCYIHPKNVRLQYRKSLVYYVRQHNYIYMYTLIQGVFCQLSKTYELSVDKRHPVLRCTYKYSCVDGHNKQVISGTGDVSF
jgi:hypothetical protein